MTGVDLTALKRRSLSILRLNAEEWAALRETRRAGAKFTRVFPHATARLAKARTPVIIVIEAGQADGGWLYLPTDDIQPQVKLAWIKSIQAIATLESRVSFDHVLTVEPNTLKALIGDQVPSRFKAPAEQLLQSKDTFQTTGPKFGEWLLDRLAAQKENDLVFRRLITLLSALSRFTDGVPLERDALSLALKTFGAPDAEAGKLALNERTTALAGARLQEDVIIEHDARWIPGWKLNSSDLTGRAVFTNGNEELQVFTANKQPLEQLFGVDLIYLNQLRRSIVMVQYKMMEPLDRSKQQSEDDLGMFANVAEAEWSVPINAQFREEMARMDRFEVAPEPSSSYRMSSSPFFFKLVRRYGKTGNSGILLSLGHLKQLLADGQLHGPRGGLRIAYSDLRGHYLRGETFADLIRSGYIGSNGATTDSFQTLIQTTLTEGRGVVAAIQRALPDSRYADFGPAVTT